MAYSCASVMVGAKRSPYRVLDGTMQILLETVLAQMYHHPMHYYDAFRLGVVYGMGSPFMTVGNVSCQHRWNVSCQH
jgi:hypothetical protein